MDDMRQGWNEVDNTFKSVDRAFAHFGRAAKSQVSSGSVSRGSTNYKIVAPGWRRRLNLFRTFMRAAFSILFRGQAILRATTIENSRPTGPQGPSSPTSGPGARRSSA